MIELVNYPDPSSAVVSSYLMLGFFADINMSIVTVKIRPFGSKTAVIIRKA